MTDDDDGQVDGDASAPAGFSSSAAASPFAIAMHAQPWLRNVGVPPWHLWGTTQQLTFRTSSFGVASQLASQLVKVSYKRPETWHWLFHARLISGPTVLNPQEAGVRVHFDVITGLGRTVVQMPSFESFQWVWTDPGGGPVPTPPTGIVMWSTSTYGPQRSYNNATPPAAVENRIDELVSQDLQIGVRLESLSNFPNTIVVEVSAFVSPKTHIRPEWLHPEAPLEQVFPGDEIGGR